MCGVNAWKFISWSCNVADNISDHIWAWTHIYATLANRKHTKKMKTNRSMLISSEQDATGRSGFVITTVPNSTSRCMHEQRYWNANRVLDRFRTNSCRNSSPNCKSGLALVRSICTNVRTQKKHYQLCIYSKHLCMSWVCTSNTVQTKHEFKNNRQLQKDYWAFEAYALLHWKNTLVFALLFWIF